jgi:hypothetical protein
LSYVLLKLLLLHVLCPPFVPLWGLRELEEIEERLERLEEVTQERRAGGRRG